MPLEDTRPDPFRLPYFQVLCSNGPLTPQPRQIGLLWKGRLQNPTAYSPSRMSATTLPSAIVRSTVKTFTSGWVSGT